MSQVDDTPRSTDYWGRCHYSDAEVDALIRRHGIYDLGITFHPTAIDWWRSVFDDAANRYFSAKAPPTNNALYRNLALVEKRTRALLDVLEDEEIDSAIMTQVEPIGSRRVLYEILQGAKRKREEIEPHLDDKRQRRGAGSGLDAAIVYLFERLDMVFQSKGKAMSIYVRTLFSPYRHKGEFVDFVCDVFELLRINVSNQTVGDHIVKKTPLLKKIRRSHQEAR